MRGNSSQSGRSFLSVGYHARDSQPHGPQIVDRNRFRLPGPITMYTDESVIETRILHDLTQGNES